jgi:hypothetical protein
MGGSRGRPAVLAGLLALALAGCGAQRQDADAPSGSFDLAVTAAKFPARQRVAESVPLRLRVANRGDDDVPDLAIIVDTKPRNPGDAPVAFAQESDDPALADGRRPVWIVDRGPLNGETAYTNTWAVGPVAGGESRAVEFQLTAVQPGSYRVRWRVAPALVGDVSVGDGRTSGTFDVEISDSPAAASVDADGQVVRGDGGASEAQ